MPYTPSENPKIFEPITIKSMTLRNRIAIGPYGSHPADPTGKPNEKTVEYYRPLAKSGVGFIMVGIVNPVPPDSPVKYNSRNNINFSTDADIAAWKKVTDMMHEYGVCCGIQIGLFGLLSRNFFSDLDEQYKKYAFNDMAVGKAATEIPTEHSNHMTKEDIDQLIRYCGDMASRAKAAGFDCISVHNAHSDIMFGACSLDPMFNSRKDDYGGPLENRLRFTVGAIREIRARVGDDYPITMRINGDDLKGELGNSLDDICKYIVPELEKAGLDAIDVSQGGSMYAGQGCLPVLYYPRACWIYISSTIKKHVHVPVFGVGRVTSMEMAEKIIREGKVDIFYFGRQAYVDTEVVHKFMAGKCMPEDVRQCIGCDTRCFPCSMNYEALGQIGAEESIPMTPAEKPKRVLILGGGVGGMEAARVAAQRGHRVTLWEKKPVLGGAVGTLAKTPLLSEFQNALDYLSGQMAPLGVDVRVCYEATLARIRDFAPDTVIFATGTSEVMPEKYAGQPMVMPLMEAIERRREFRSFADWHKKVWFSGFTGCEFALDLAEQGAEVTMVGPGRDDAVAAEPWFTRDRAVYLRKKLTDANYIRRSKDTERANVRMLFQSRIESVDEAGVHYYHNGIHKVDEYDVVILTAPRRKNDALFDEVKQMIPETYKIGDCDKTGLIRDAIRSANLIARTI